MRLTFVVALMHALIFFIACNALLMNILSVYLSDRPRLIPLNAFVNVLIHELQLFFIKLFNNRSRMQCRFMMWQIPVCWNCMSDYCTSLCEVYIASEGAMSDMHIVTPQY